jgi:dipeptidyl aminopeptidase/acylaminoacyl peptidase
MLAAGSTLGPYKILALLGAGGMGEVYRAHDTRLGRDVAIKVLAPHLAATPEVRARFEREARTISQLNHPHVCTLHDVGREGETEYLVMELLEGETLAHRLEKGPLPLAEVLALGTQIADALDRAHRAGVVHRDLKPGNIMLTKAGAKLMDFGLARAAGMAGAPGTLTESPTVSRPLTAEGTIVGTFQYMAPEQLEGKEADARTDLWALGCVLYEMATGKRAFEGASQASLISAIMKDEPRPITELQPLTPPMLDHLVKRCLAKDPDKRWQSAGDLAREFEWVGAAGSQVGVPAPALAKRPRRDRLAWWAVVALAVVALAALAIALRYGRSASAPVSFTSVTFRPVAIFKAAFAPDGKTIVFSGALEGNVPRLFIIRPEYPEPVPLGNPGTHLLSVSANGELAVLTGARYVAQRLFTGTLARMPLGGGAPREILENVREADWAPDGSRLAVIREVQGKDRLEFPIGNVLYETGGYVSDLRFSPKGDRIAFFEHPGRFDDRGSVNVVDLHGKRTTLSDGYWGEEGIAWDRKGREILFSASLSGGAWSIYAVTPSARRRIALQSAGGLTIQDVSAQGRWLTTRDEQLFRVMVHAPAWQEDRDLAWLDGSLNGILSQDGRTLVFTEQSSVMGNNYAVCLRRTDEGDVVRLGEGDTRDLSADGRKVLAQVFSPPRFVIYPTGAGEPLRLDLRGLENLQGGHFFPSGDSILFLGNEPGKAPRYYVQHLVGGPRRAMTPEGTREGVLSRDGRFVLAKGPDDKYHLYPLVGGEPRSVPWLKADDRPLAVSASGRSVIAARWREIPLRVERIDLESGRRTLIREIAPTDRVGLVRIALSFVSDDERSYAYWTWSWRSTLFTVEWGR